jgi:hypothetical protein
MFTKAIRKFKSTPRLLNLIMWENLAVARNTKGIGVSRKSVKHEDVAWRIGRSRVGRHRKSMVRRNGRNKTIG